jgi:hypothetical protein
MRGDGGVLKEAEMDGALFAYVLGNDEYLKSKNGSAFTIEAHN